MVFKMALLLVLAKKEMYLYFQYFEVVWSYENDFQETIRIVKGTSNVTFTMYVIFYQTLIQIFV